MMKTPTPASLPEGPTPLEYIGPPDHSHPDFGPLVVGRRYQIPAALAVYLVVAHPDYWRAQPPKE